MAISKFKKCCIGIPVVLLSPLFILCYLLLNPNVAWYIVGPCLYMLDAGTDLYASYSHYTGGHVWWGTLTLFFTLAPVLFTGSFITYSVIQCKDSLQCKGVWMAGCICIAPFLPLLLLAKSAVVRIIASINASITNWSITKDWLGFEPLLLPTIPFIDYLLTAFGSSIGHGSDDAVLNAGILKLLEAMLESLPQAALQLYIIAHDWPKCSSHEPNICHDWKGVAEVGTWQWTTHDWKGVVEVGTWQWTTVAVSLMALAVNIATNNYVFENVSTIGRVVIFIFGLMTVTSRIITCALYAIIIKFLFLLPLGCGLAATIIVRLRAKLTPWHGSDIWGVSITVLTWLLTATFNCFTYTGLPASALNLGFAFVLLALSVPKPLAIVAITLASISFVCNVLLMVVPFFRSMFEDQWMNMNTLNLSPGEVQSKEFILKYSCAKNVYVRPNKSGDQELQGWKTAVYGATHIYRKEVSGMVCLTPDPPPEGKCTVCWRVNWFGSGLVPKNFTVSLPHKAENYTHSHSITSITAGNVTFSNNTDCLTPGSYTGRDITTLTGDVSWSVEIGSKSFKGDSDGLIEKTDLELTEPVRHLDVVAQLQVGWHKTGQMVMEVAQLFPQTPTDTSNFPFLINIQFSDEKASKCGSLAGTAVVQDCGPGDGGHSEFP